LSDELTIETKQESQKPDPLQVVHRTGITNCSGYSICK
jgi:hypothetical protein